VKTGRGKSKGREKGEAKQQPQHAARKKSQGHGNSQWARKKKISISVVWGKRVGGGVNAKNDEGKARNLILQGCTHGGREYT